MIPPSNPKGIVVFDVGSTNTKLILFDEFGQAVASESIKSARLNDGPYLAVDPEPVFLFAANTLPKLDDILPVDIIMPSAHGSALALLDDAGELVLPIMDYLAQPPDDISLQYQKIAPHFDEVFAPTLPGALTLGLQLFWQQSLFPDAFSRIKTILPWGQYVAHRLGGRMVTELSSLGAQTHLWDYNSGTFSSLAHRQLWADKFAPFARAYEYVGELGSDYRGEHFIGQGTICAGVHDSDANYLRYLAGVTGDFTLLSTGTWIIGFDTKARIEHADPARDCVANLNIFGEPVATCRFFGGREYDIISSGISSKLANEQVVQSLIDRHIFALASFTDSGGPIPQSGCRGRILGDLTSKAQRVSLATLYCALMVSESLDAIGSNSTIIVDGPFSSNHLFLSLLAGLRSTQKVLSSSLRDGTTDGARLIALMGPDGKIPQTHLDLDICTPAQITGLKDYQARWKTLCRYD